MWKSRVKVTLTSKSFGRRPRPSHLLRTSTKGKPEENQTVRIAQAHRAINSALKACVLRVGRTKALTPTSAGSARFSFNRSRRSAILALSDCSLGLYILRNNAITEPHIGKRLVTREPVVFDRVVSARSRQIVTWLGSPDAIVPPF
jgi:hypothetical protein